MDEFSTLLANSVLILASQPTHRPNGSNKQQFSGAGSCDFRDKRQIPLFAAYVGFRQFLFGEQRVFSRHSLQIECWFLEIKAPMGHTNGMNSSFLWQEGVSDEITAKYLIFDDVSDLTISGAHRDGFCARMCPSLEVGVYRRDATLPWDHGRLVVRKNPGRYVVWCHSEGHVGRWEGKLSTAVSSAGRGEGDLVERGSPLNVSSVEQVESS